eukprot:265628_1
MRFDSGVRISDSDSSGYWNQESGSKDPEPVSASVKLKSNSRSSSKSRLKGSQYECGEPDLDKDKHLKHPDKLGKSTANSDKKFRKSVPDQVVENSEFTNDDGEPAFGVLHKEQYNSKST